jgi:hypothetical protein
MRRIVSYELHRRLLCWAAYEYKFANNLLGWPKENGLYKFLREGFTDTKGKPKKSKIPFDYPEEADDVNKAFNELMKINQKAALAFYLYYVNHVKVTEYAPILNISRRAFYKRLDKARAWFIDKIKV